MVSRTIPPTRSNRIASGSSRTRSVASVTGGLVAIPFSEQPCGRLLIILRQPALDHLVHQELLGPADDRARRHAERDHDLIPVQRTLDPRDICLAVLLVHASEQRI